MKQSYFSLTKCLVFILLTTFGLTLHSQSLTDKEKIIVHDKAFKIIENYALLINQIGEEISDVDKTKSNIESFIDLYVNRKTLVYNDLDPAHLLSEYYEVETYISNLSLWYPDGINITLDYNSASISNVINHGNNVYSVDIAIPKNIEGNYLNKTMNTNEEKLLFRVAFSKEKIPVKFKIAGIRDVSGGTASFNNKSLVEVNSAEFTEDQEMKIKEYCLGMLNDYVNYLTLLGNEDELEDDKVFYREALHGLFVETDNIHYNDLEEKAEDNYLSIEEYVDLYSQNFPVINNVSLNTDSAKFGRIIKNSDGSFYMELVAQKFFSAKLRGKNLYRSQNSLVFKLKFIQNGNSFSDFVFESIDDEGISKALAVSSEQNQSVAEFAHLAKLSKKGLYIGAALNVGQAGIINQNIKQLTLEKNSLEWIISPDINYGGKIYALYMTNNWLGLEAGVGYNHLETNYSISSKKIPIDQNLVDISGLRSDIEPFAFVDKAVYYLDNGVAVPNDPYVKILQMDNYDSLLTFDNLQIPLLVNFSLGKPGKTSIILKAGLEVNYMMVSKTEVLSGFEHYFIFAPDGTELQDDKYFYPGSGNFGELNLYRNEGNPNIISRNNNDISKLYIDGYIGAYVDIPFGYFLTINAGLILKTSFSDLYKSDNPYVDVFGRTEKDYSLAPTHVFDHLPTKVKTVMFEIGVKYKL